jgi:hypothetical protein
MPVAGAYVVVVEASVPMPEIALVADVQGCFALNLPEGRFRLRAEADGRSGEVEVTVPGDDDVRIRVS